MVLPTAIDQNLKLSQNHQQIRLFYAKQDLIDRMNDEAQNMLFRKFFSMIK